MRNHGVVGGEFRPRLGRSSWPLEELLVAAGKVAVVKRVFGKEVEWELHFGGQVLRLVAGRQHQRIVRGREVDVEKKRFVGLLLE